MTLATTLFASALATTCLLGCDAGPGATPVPSEPPTAVRAAAVGPSAQGATVFKLRSTGTFAEAAWSDGNHFGFLFVTRAQSQTGGKSVQQAFLLYEIIQCGAVTCDPVEGGFGPIPAQDVSGNGKRALSLNTDTSTNPDFIHSEGSGGLVEVDWIASDLFSRKSHGVEQSRFGDVTFKSNGSFSSTSATASGSVIDSRVEAELGVEMGMSHDRFIDIFR